jgi:hypothetical protein
VLASDNDNPAAPNTRALLRRFRFEVCFAWGIVTSGKCSTGGPLLRATDNIFYHSDNVIAKACVQKFQNFLTKLVIHDRRMHAVESLQTMQSAAGRNRPLRRATKGLPDL